MRLISFAIIAGIMHITACSKDRNIISIAPNDKVQLGKKIFFDKHLSNPIGQSCASCHSPEAAFSDQAHGITSQGAVLGLFSNRNAPSIAIARSRRLFILTAMTQYT